MKTEQHNFIIPSIDLLDGNIVRLYKGNYEEKTIYNLNFDDLLDKYKDFENLHIVDLNGARGDGQKNLPLIKDIRKIFTGKIQLGGGIRSLEIVEKMLVNLEIDKVILGTIAITDESLTKEILNKFGKNRVILAIDCELKNRKYFPKINGWNDFASDDLFKILLKYYNYAEYILITDIALDGTMHGPNFELYRQIKEKFPNYKLQASGGISSINDLKKLKEITDFAIIGKALYQEGIMEYFSMMLEFNKCKSLKRAEISKGFFKTEIGQYAEGDLFVGVAIPEIRKIAKKYSNISSFEIISSLVSSKIHEERMLATLLLLDKFENEKNDREAAKIVDFYLSDQFLAGLNNWDLVDVSCYKILGIFILNNPQKIDILYNFAKSDNLWKKRIAIVSTFAFIKNNSFEDAIKIVEILLKDGHNLIQKATGWMLREIGKKSKETLINFLNKNAGKMPRVQLSYAIEKLTEAEKKFYRSLC